MARLLVAAVGLVQELPFGELASIDIEWVPCPAPQLLQASFLRGAQFWAGIEIGGVNARTG